MRHAKADSPATAAPPAKAIPRFIRCALALVVLACCQALAQGQPSGSHGALAPGETRENVLAPATGDALVYHTYTVSVPAGLALLTVRVDGMGNDIDLALKFGSEISSYDEATGDYDYLDFSEEPNPSHGLANPTPGILYVDVVNLIERPAAYRLTVTAQSQAGTAPAPSGDVFAGTFSGQGMTLALAPAPDGYQGRLDFQGKSYPVTARAQGLRLAGTFSSGGQEFPFDATLSADLLTLGSGGASYLLLRQGGGAQAGQPTPAPAAPAQVAPAASAAITGLEGKWTRQVDFGYGTVTDYSLYFLPDGRYFYVESGDFPVQEEGRFSVAGGQLTFEPFCSPDYSADFQLGGAQLSVATVDVFGDTTTSLYQLEPGSPVGVVQEIAAVDAERAAFHARTPTGPIQPGARAPEPGFPIDPSPERTFAPATAFSEGELYTRFSAYTYVMDFLGQLQTVNASDIAFNTAKMATLNYSRGEYRDSGLWLFAPNGRVFLKFESYWNALDISTDPITPSVVSAWGRYRIENDTIFVETDVGEQLTLELIAGRRQLSQDGLCFDEVAWATEQLEGETRRQQGGD